MNWAELLLAACLVHFLEKNNSFKRDICIKFYSALSAERFPFARILQNLIVNIFVGIMMLYFLALFLLIGFMLPKMLRNRTSNPSEIFHGIMLCVVWYSHGSVI